MKRKYWLSSKRRQMAKLHDLQRQLQEAWDERDELLDERDMSHAINLELVADARNLAAQLHRVARERDKERELRLAAEDRRDVYLAELANEEE